MRDVYKKNLDKLKQFLDDKIVEETKDVIPTDEVEPDEKDLVRDNIDEL